MLAPVPQQPLERRRPLGVGAPCVRGGGGCAAARDGRCCGGAVGDRQANMPPPLCCRRLLLLLPVELLNNMLAVVVVMVVVLLGFVALLLPLLLDSLWSRWVLGTSAAVLLLPDVEPGAAVEALLAVVAVVAIGLAMLSVALMLLLLPPLLLTPPDGTAAGFVGVAAVALRSFASSCMLTDSIPLVTHRATYCCCCKLGSTATPRCARMA